jgi:uncharacterized protein YbbK (DUF523 family)
MEKILVSACLLGDKVRYDGGSNPVGFLSELAKRFQIVPFCPEVEGGLAIPRDPAEISGNRVVTKNGVDVTANYHEGAQKALTLCKFFGIRYAILKDGSPACGPRQIHDGKFDGLKIDGLGVTARLLVANGIKVFAETDNISFLWNKPTEFKRDKPLRKKRNGFPRKPHTLAEAAEEAAKKETPTERNGKGEARGASFDRRKKPYGERHSYNRRAHEFEARGKTDERYGGEKAPYGKGAPLAKGKSFGERKSYGKKKPYGRKPYGTPKPYGEKAGRKDGGRKPDGGSGYYDHKPYGSPSSHGFKKAYGHKNYRRSPSNRAKAPFNEKK